MYIGPEGPPILPSVSPQTVPEADFVPEVDINVNQQSLLVETNENSQILCEKRPLIPDLSATENISDSSNKKIKLVEFILNTATSLG
jgi:hypothetical protein